MTSAVVVLMSIFAFFVISSETATIQDYEEFPGSNIVKDLCPTVGFTAIEYRVSAITEMSSDLIHIGGCGLIDIGTTADVSRKSFSLWIGSLNNGMQRCREKDMEHFNFSCVAESPPQQSYDYMKGIMFAQLIGLVNNNDKKPRCAIHDMVRGNATMFRIAVSGDDSCHGLADLLQSNLQTTIPKGAMVLQLTRIKLVSNQLQAEHLTSKENIKNHFPKIYTSGSLVNKL